MTLESKIIAKRVLEIESSAILKMSKNLPSDFSKTVKAILKISGRVIVSGVGKSGHIGNKIAATLASTGTPANFVHATEASHGDLGMFTHEDFCLLISNSGETSELHDIVSHTSRFGIPMAAISSNMNSTLMKAADYKLLLPDAPEACSIGLAPTTSTTLMLALGDALAVSLTEQRNFKPEDFKILHPGGKLGSRMITVSQLMHFGKALPIVGPKTSMQEALIEMTSKGFGVAIVESDNKLVGIITDGDLRRYMNELMTSNAGEIVGPNPITIKKDNLAGEALKKMNQNKISVLIVVDEIEKVIGILHVHDLLRAGVA